jgi:predicted NACHT family NTPase
MEWLNKKDVQTYSLVYDVSQLLSSSVVRSKSERTIFLNSDLLDTAKRSLLVTGAAGYGKTSFCRWNTLKDIDDLLAGRSTRVPIYVALHRLSQGPLNSLGDLLKTASNDSAMTEELDSKLLMRRPTRLYLDGLDEIASSERQQQIVEIVRETVERCPNLQVIFTGRDYVSGPWLHWLARVQISEFDNAEIREFVEKWLGNDRKQIDLFYTQLSAAVNLIPLLAVPLLASLILSVYRKTGQLPESKVRLYELFVNLLCGGWDDAKQVQRHGRFGAEIKKQVLTHLAASLHHSKKRECTDHDFRVAMKAVTPKLVNKWPELLEDLLRDGLLLSTGSWYGFAHLSFQEYLAAKELLDSTGDEATLRLQWYLQGDNWWKEVLSFYVGMVQNPTTTERWIRSTIKSVQSKPESSGRATFLLERLLETFTAFELSDTRVELPKPLKY